MLFEPLLQLGLVHEGNDVIRLDRLTGALGKFDDLPAGQPGQFHRGGRALDTVVANGHVIGASGGNHDAAQSAVEEIALDGRPHGRTGQAHATSA